MTATPPLHYTGQLLLTHWRELSRNRATFYFVLVFPFVMFAGFLGLNKLVGGNQSGGTDLATIQFPMLLCLSLAFTCMILTAGPIAEYREQGTLRILGTTPVSRSAFIGTHLLVRFGLSLAVSIAAAGVGVVVGLTPASALWKASLVAVPASVLLLGLGYIIGSLINSAQAAQAMTTIVGVALVFLSGIGLPPMLLPDGAVRVLDMLPTAYFGDLLYWVAGSSFQRHSTAVDGIVLAACAVVVVPIAVKTFRWEARKN
ncbi:ABC transporter permease [Actinomyces sp.]|uniref:ABC transporter permease n=1 Tax=Actinomyces sp. TaxID=29317 RepID=UPI0026DAEEB2|nr:ABC transporter permease [Actinomyces sp.]MDO4900408.1 ABC transporter permease [Actinomyces sp.]